MPPSILEDYEIIKDIPLEDVRSFGFIAHIDHGKSSLSSRILELTGNLGRPAQQLALAAAVTDDGTVIPSENDESNNEQTPTISTGKEKVNKEQIDALDTLDVEKQRGITVKASAASMLYPHPSAKGKTGYLLLNMYDTPGHVDFGREVTRSLCFIQGAVLLLDATQGIQAQTWSVYDKVMALKPKEPKLLIALTKVDLEAARPIHCAVTVSEWLQDWEGDPDSILNTSARSRIGIKALLDSVCDQVPPPESMDNGNVKGDILRAQVVDSWYDDRGVNCLVRVVSGQLTESDRVSIVHPGQEEGTRSGDSYSVQEVGIVTPKPLRTKVLYPGQMGYTRFGLRDPRQAMPGTVVLWTKQVGMDMPIPQLPSDAVSKSVLYASVHPEEADGFEDLFNAVERLALNDTGLEVQRTSAQGDGGEGGGPFLGPGLRVGFQGLLHVEVFRQRLSDEFGIEAIVTPPKVKYRVTLSPGKGSNLKDEITKTIEDLSEWPDSGTKSTIEEPIVLVRVVARVEDAGGVMDLISRKRGTELETKPLDEEQWVFTAKMPWAEVVIDFHDQLKNVTAGFGSMDTFEAGYAKGNLSKVDIMLNGDAVDPLAFVCHKDVAQREARVVCKKLQEVLPRQQFVTVIQAKAGSKVIASERIQAYRKDVLTKSGKTVGGGDMTRKKKLLEKQKKGKKRMQHTGKVQLSQAAFNSVITRSS